MTPTLALAPTTTSPAITAGFELAGVAIAVTDTQLRILAVNAAYAALTGEPIESLPGRLLAAAALAGPQLSCAAMHATLAQGWQGEALLPQRDGPGCPVWMNVTARHDADGLLVGHVVALTDISVLHRERDALERRAMQDPLTGLPHRGHFDTELARTIAGARRHGRRLALLFIDVDQFKHVNDQLGHQVGDALLCEVAHRLRAAVRSEDLVARYGGDEFAVLLPEVADEAQAARAAAGLLMALQHRCDAAGPMAAVSVSIGVALFPTHARSAPGLLREADLAMYRAKQYGRGCFVVSEAR